MTVRSLRYPQANMSSSAFSRLSSSWPNARALGKMPGGTVSASADTPYRMPSQGQEGERRLVDCCQQRALGSLQAVCANLIVEIGHFPSCPLIEIRRPCISSSETLSTVPAFPSVRITALPISSVWTCSNSQRILDARTWAVSMGDSVSEFERAGVCT